MSWNPRDPRFIPFAANIATKPIIVLCNGPQIDRLQAKFWDRLNAIQAQADSECLVVGVNRIGIAEAALKHRYKPDVMATVDAPTFRMKTRGDLTKEAMAKAAEKAAEEKKMAKLKAIDPALYEMWAAKMKRLDDLEAVKDGAAERVPTETTDAFARSFRTVAGFSTRIVSQQAVYYLQPSTMPTDVVLNMDTSTAGPPDRARMLFTTADWITNWLARIGCREFYFYGMSMRPEDGRHCKCLGFEEPDDYSWSDKQRHKNCFAAWRHLRDSFPGLKLYNCDRKSYFVERGEMEYGIPKQLEDGYQLLSDEACLARAKEVMRIAVTSSADLIAEMERAEKKAREDAQLLKLRAQMEADKARASA